MRRLEVGARIRRADGRLMDVLKVEHTDGLRIVWWRHSPAEIKAAA